MIGIDCEYIPIIFQSDQKPHGRADVTSTYCEIVQIGACKLDAQGKEIATLDLMIKSHKIPHTPAWFSELTGISAHARSEGISFPEALNQLINFIDSDNSIWTFNCDWWVLQANAATRDIQFPFAESDLKRLKPLLKNYNIDLVNFQNKGYSEICSGHLAEVLEINLESSGTTTAHNATHDARNLIKSAYHLGLR